MDWPPPCRRAVATGLLALASALGASSEGRGAERPAHRLTFGDLASYQEPAPAPPPRPAQATPASPTPAPVASRPSLPATPTAPIPRAAATPATRTAPFAGAIDPNGPNPYRRRTPAFSDLGGLPRPGRTYEMLGDRGFSSALVPFRRTPPVPNPPPPIPGPNPPPVPGEEGRARRGLILAPTIRSFKIAEDQSPKPLDRVYTFSNYFNNVNRDANRRLGAPVRSIQAYRTAFGFEKTFDEGRGSIGAQLPINSLTVDAPGTNLGGTTTTVGDLTLIAKYALWVDPESGSLVSAGLAVTTPTGSSSFAGNRGVTSLHYPVLTPYLGYLWNRDRLFVQGFSSVSTPTNSRDVTFLFNDIGVGYAVYRDDDPDACLNAVVPTFEVHVNTPLNHRSINLRDPAGTADVVDFTYGLNAFVGGNTRFSVGVVTPVTRPRPFAFEVLAQLTYQF